jgi:hypothetical protein
VHAGKKEIRCYTFAHVMVKEIDAGEVGDEQISFLPVGLPCQAKTAPNEHVVPGDKWSGYFLGAKGDYVLLSAEDGVNGGLGFSVYHGVDTTSLFQDSAKLEQGRVHFQSIESDASGLRLRYTRVYTGACSVQTDGTSCWTRIVNQVHLPAATPPDCAAGYLKAKQELAKARCEAAHRNNAACIEQEVDGMKSDDSSPSVIGYDADVTVLPPQTSIQPASGPVACWPAD